MRTNIDDSPGVADKSRELRDYVRLPTLPLLPEQPCSKRVIGRDVVFKRSSRQPHVKTDVQRGAHQGIKWDHTAPRAQLSEKPNTWVNKVGFTDTQFM
jgi:hypothetical protein